VLAGVPVDLAVDDPVRRIKPWPSARPGRRLQAQAVCGGDPSLFAAPRISTRLPANCIDFVARLSAASVLIDRE
jgi:hypothetical protein